MVVETREYRMWADGGDSADAARRLNQRDPTLLLEAAAAADQTGGGVHATVPAAWEEIYDSYEDVGPRLPDGSFWGPGAIASWPRTAAALSRYGDG
jgi:hypothetical protein